MLKSNTKLNSGLGMMVVTTGITYMARRFGYYHVGDWLTAFILVGMFLIGLRWTAMGLAEISKDNQDDQDRRHPE